MSYVVTLGFDAAASGVLDALRREHFPAERNFLAAHLTLFHQLPEDAAADVPGTLAALADRTPAFPLVFEAPIPLGRGVAIRAAAPELPALRRRLAERFAPWLTPQDAGGFRPHVTVQNKVTPAAARALLARLQASWRPLHGRAESLQLWRYAGGPWDAVDTYAFGGADARDAAPALPQDP